MSATELQHLVKMINQISANIATIASAENDELALQVADHLQRFWARSMKQKIISYADNDGAGLSIVSKQAVVRLQADF
jgi:formate dehydrogenase subunit delta